MFVFFKALHRVLSKCIKHIIKDTWLMILDVSSNLNDYIHQYLAEQPLKQALQFGNEEHPANEHPTKP